MAQPGIESVVPNAGVEGGEVIITCTDFVFSTYGDAHVRFSGAETRPLSASSTRVIAPVPSDMFIDGGECYITLESNGSVSEGVPFIVGVKLAENLHPVANPAYDRDNGAVYTTLSGTRGQKVPVSVYKITPGGESEPFLTDMTNPSGLAFSPGGEMFITSRYDGTVYRVLDDGGVEAVATDLGVACGLAFAADGSLFVGDRSGTIHRLLAGGAKTETFALLPPSVAAYHLAFGPDEHLYVTGPTMATCDAVYRFDASGRVEVLDRTFGRPQGLGFDPHGELHVVEALAGATAIYRLPAAAPRQAVVAGPGLIGVAFDRAGALVAATTESLYRFPAIP